jgi:hypothetical protein
MLLPIPAQFRRRRGRPAPASSPPGPGPLVLLSAIYIPDDGSGNPTLTLAFDREIDPSGYTNTAILVRDGETRLRLLMPNGGFDMLDPQTVLFVLNELGGLRRGRSS